MCFITSLRRKVLAPFEKKKNVQVPKNNMTSTMPLIINNGQAVRLTTEPPTPFLPTSLKQPSSQTAQFDCRYTRYPEFVPEGAYHHPNHAFSAYCKFPSRMRSRLPIDLPPPSLCPDDLIIALFIRDFHYIQQMDPQARYTDLMAELPLLAIWIQEHFPTARAIRFVVFYPKTYITESMPVPKSLLNLFGSCREMGRWLHGIGTLNDVERTFCAKYVQKEEDVYRYTPVQIRDQCLKVGTLLPIRPGEIEMPVKVGTQPIEVPERKVVKDEAWIPGREFAWA